MLTIDPHAHFLYATDDGPETLEESLAMVRLAAADGVRTVYCTSHLSAEDDVAAVLAERRVKRETLQQAADAEGLGVQFKNGAEWLLTEDFRDVLAQNPEGYLGTTDAFLFELTPYQPMRFVPMFVREAVSSGKRVLFAHPERYRQLTQESCRFELSAVIAAGALLQLTAGSFTGLFGKTVEKLAWTLLEAFPNDVVLASDAHEPRVRVPGLSAAAVLIEKRFPGQTNRMQQRLEEFLGV